MTTARPVSALSFARVLLLALALPVCAGLVGGCSTAHDVRQAKANGVMGTTKIYSVTPEHARALAKTILAQSAGRAVDDHAKDGYLSTASAGSLAPWGSEMGAWVERFDNTNTRVTFYVESKVALTEMKNALTEETLHQRFAKALSAGQ